MQNQQATLPRIAASIRILNKKKQKTLHGYEWKHEHGIIVHDQQQATKKQAHSWPWKEENQTVMQGRMKACGREREKLSNAAFWSGATCLPTDKNEDAMSTTAASYLKAYRARGTNQAVYGVYPQEKATGWSHRVGS